MNPVAMPIIDPRKEYWPSGNQTSDLLFSSLQRYQLRYGAWLNRYIHIIPFNPLAHNAAF